MNDWSSHLSVFEDFVQSDFHRDKFQFTDKLEIVDSRLVCHSKKYYMDFPLFDFFNIANGQGNSAEPLYDGFWLLDELSVLEHIESTKEFYGIFHNDFDEKIAKVVKPHVANGSWFPLAMDGFGETLCIDFDPGDSGCIGQIIKDWHDCAKKELIAENLSDFCINVVGM